MDRTCKSCKYYSVKTYSNVTGVLFWKREEIMKDSICSRFGVSGIPCDKARGSIELSHWTYYPTHSVPVYRYVDGPCGMEGKFWDPK